MAFNWRNLQLILTQTQSDSCSKELSRCIKNIFMARLAYNWLWWFHPQLEKFPRIKADFFSSQWRNMYCRSSSMILQICRFLSIFILIWEIVKISVGRTQTLTWTSVRLSVRCKRGVRGVRDVRGTVRNVFTWLVGLLTVNSRAHCLFTAPNVKLVWINLMIEPAGWWEVDCWLQDSLITCLAVPSSVWSIYYQQLAS